MKNSQIKKAAALKYDQARNMAPRVVAKGKGHIAEQIVRVARENDVPMHADPNLVNVLEALELEAEIPAELYRAVAEVLVFIYQNILDRIPNNTALGTPGSRVRVVGVVELYKGDLEVVPVLPYDVVVLP